MGLTHCVRVLHFLSVKRRIDDEISIVRDHWTRLRRNESKPSIFCGVGMWGGRTFGYGHSEGSVWRAKDMV